MVRLRYPMLEKTCDLVAEQMDVTGPEFRRADFLYDRKGGDALIVYVCLDSDSLALATAITLHQRTGEKNIPVVVRMTHDAGLATLLEGSEGGNFVGLRAFGLLDRVCKPELLLCGLNERLAQSIHEDYVRRQRERGETRQSNPAIVPWDELPESVKESNRGQADDIGQKLKLVDCGLRQMTNWDIEPFAFEPAEVETLARLEHERYVKERLGAGWSYKPGSKNLEAKTNPTLVPWAELSDAEKDKDRQVVMDLPYLLAEAGFEIYRTLAADEMPLSAALT